MGEIFVGSREVEEEIFHGANVHAFEYCEVLAGGVENFL